MATTLALTDNFDDNVKGAQWGADGTLISNGATTTTTPISEVNARTEITPATGTAGADYNGRISAATYNLRGKRFFVRLKALGVVTGLSTVAGQLQAGLGTGTSTSGYRAIYNGDNRLYLQKQVSGATTNIANVAEGLDDNWRWLSFRFGDVGDDTIYIDTYSGAHDPPLETDWVQRLSGALDGGLDITNTKVGFWAGAYGGHAATTPIYFDGFNTGTVAASGTSGSGAGAPGTATTTAPAGIGTGSGNAAGSPGTVPATTPTGVASGSASGSRGTSAVALTAPSGTATASGHGLGAPGTVSVTAPAGTASGAASAAGSPGTVAATAPTGVATSTGAGAGAGSPGQVTMAAPSGVGTGSASASGSPGQVSAVAPSGTASGTTAATGVGSPGNVAAVAPTGRGIGTGQGAGATNVVQLFPPEGRAAAIVEGIPVPSNRTTHASALGRTTYAHAIRTTYAPKRMGTA